MGRSLTSGHLCGRLRTPFSSPWILGLHTNETGLRLCCESRGRWTRGWAEGAGRCPRVHTAAREGGEERLRGSGSATRCCVSLEGWGGL